MSTTITLPRLTDGVIAAYHAGDRAAYRLLCERGAALIPGLRLADCPTAALTFHAGTAAEIAVYVEAAYAENRVQL